VPKKLLSFSNALLNVSKNIVIDPDSVTIFTNFENSIKNSPKEGKDFVISSPIDWKIVVTSFS
jgi:hypothetical protein